MVRNSLISVFLATMVLATAVQAEVLCQRGSNRNSSTKGVTVAVKKCPRGFKQVSELYKRADVIKLVADELKKGNAVIAGPEGQDGANGIDGRPGVVNTDSCYRRTLQSAVNADLIKTVALSCDIPGTQFMLSHASYSVDGAGFTALTATRLIVEAKDGKSVPTGFSAQARALTSITWSLISEIVCCAR